MPDERLVPTAVAAAALKVRPATVNTLTRRGQLTPTACDCASRAALFPLLDVLALARARGAS